MERKKISAFLHEFYHTCRIRHRSCRIYFRNYTPSELSLSHLFGGSFLIKMNTFVYFSVSDLMEEIERECGVMASQQVLLMSGGMSLDPKERVCSYPVGTDTNPIYLFSKANIESSMPPTPSINYGSGE